MREAYRPHAAIHGPGGAWRSVADVNRAKVFDELVGSVCDAGYWAGGCCVVQLTPAGSGCSVRCGPGCESRIIGMLLLVAGLAAAVECLTQGRRSVGEPFHYGATGKQPGIDPLDAGYGSSTDLHCPDGNTWLLHEVPSRRAQSRQRTNPAAPSAPVTWSVLDS